MQDAAVAAAQQPSASAATTRSVTSTKTPTGLLAKLNFITGRSSADCCPSPRTMDDHEPDRGHEPDHEDEQDDAPASTSGSRAFTTAIHQHRTRRRRGSLRKVALLGRGAQRDKKDSSPLTVDTSTAPILSEDWSTDATPRANHQTQHGRYDALGLKHVDLTPQDHRRKDPSRPAFSSPAPTTNLNEVLGSEQDAPMLYHSTTDEEDGLQLPSRPGTLPLSSGSESYFPSVPSAQRRPSFQQTKSPLSYNGLSPTPLQPSDAQVDYAETEWWGWIILIVTWLVFVVGMGSCLGVWSWAWDVGKTPYAPPELEDDPTLPIVGYYPALIILTAVMAWVWVVVAWVGMKYFRHAKISGD